MIDIIYSNHDYSGKKSSVSAVVCFPFVTFQFFQTNNNTDSEKLYNH